MCPRTTINVSRTRRPRGATWNFCSLFIFFLFFLFFRIHTYAYIYTYTYTNGLTLHLLQERLRTCLPSWSDLLYFLYLLYLLQFFTTGGLTLLLLQERLRTRLPSWSDLLYLLYFTYFLILLTLIFTTGEIAHASSPGGETYFTSFTLLCFT